MIKLYNSLSKQKEVFKPIKANHLSIYVCGVTVYDYCHIGHARAYTAFDIITRFFSFMGYKVNYIRNITDIDDKIIKRANELNTGHADISEKYTKAMHEDLAKLNILPPNHEPKATESLDLIINLIEKLIANGYAYVGTDGDVYYNVKKYKTYGQLAHKNLEELRLGERIAVADDKQDPLDFVLWKKAKANEPSWPSPWGAGRPGWHIECSAMSTNALGNNFDIHGGGNDLKFPHHENERAQSEAATGETFVNYWMHCGFVQFNDEKMSKSLGNFFTIREVLAKYHPEIIRYFLIATHYRSPINYSLENLDNAKIQINKLYSTVRDINVTNAKVDTNNAYLSKFKTVMADDFNTPGALAILFEIVKDINKTKIQTEKENLAAILLYLGNILGILQYNASEILQGDNDTIWIDELIKKREIARKTKDFATADNIRDELLAKGITLEDRPAGTIWRRIT